MRYLIFLLIAIVAAVVVRLGVDLFLFHKTMNASDLLAILVFSVIYGLVTLVAKKILP